MKTIFSDRILEWFEKSAKRHYILISPKDLLQFVDYIFNECRARYIIVSGMDTPAGIELFYHFALDQAGIVVSLRTILPGKTPSISSISSIITGAQWIEREIREILGVEFLNHPAPRPFLMSEDWPEGVYPLRREK
jgi:Ni,Fe-hydrogenase III component G